MTPQEILEGVAERLGVIADELQQGQMIEEDDALGRRLVVETLEIERAISAIDH